MRIDRFIDKSIIAVGFVLALVAGGCGGSLKSVEESEETTAMIEAAQMEGRNAAKAFATKEWKDTLSLQNHLLEAKAIQSKYVIAKQPKCAAAFDSTFVSTMKTVRPDIAAHLLRHYNR